jgi:3-hydroxyisobutyrate dehydrogenase
MTENALPPLAVALLGAGIMGAGMGRNIARAGIPLRVWNRTRDRAEPLAADGAAVADSPADAVRGAGIIVTMLADGPAVSEVVSAAAEGLAPGQIWVQTATVGPEWNGKLAGLARDRGLVYLDAPVLGTRQPAEQGQLTVFAAGPEQPSDPAGPGQDRDAAGPRQERDRVRERVRPVLDAIGRQTVWLDEVGAGTRLKLVANSWVEILNVAAGETIALAQGLGVDPQDFLDTVAGSPVDSPYLHAKAKAILTGDYTPAFSVDGAASVSELIIEAGEGAGLHMDLARAAAGRFRRAIEQGRGGDDMAAAYFASFDN